MSEWIDIAVPLDSETVRWPGDRAFRLQRDCDMSCGHAASVSSFEMSAHLGTHMDAPLHYFRDGASMDGFPLEIGIGPARVIAIEGDCAGPDSLDVHRIERDERILLKTANSNEVWHHRPFSERYVSITPAGARYLVERHPALVGVDYLSVGNSGDDGAETHRILLKAGIWIIEALDLHRVTPGNYDLVCLPLRIVGVEGAPVRAALRRIQETGPGQKPLS